MLEKKGKLFFEKLAWLGNQKTGDPKKLTFKKKLPLIKIDPEKPLTWKF